ncbi:DUF2848 domain-containing protein [Elioraea sp. Yellowstone]|jgi:hypothetical protein|uniref:DUF2848 domain-containing protein n=1 Tax=Elioraea sp. Yellowstone TaxID=2592070 RepID=UPI001153B5D8|nr:DUF2848 domain-containing protein [Elioraea sp. Yellowstone]TQF83710.1 DUF2848 domain-containing protein [Elioraea sp. Yellowstone]
MTSALALRCLIASGSRDVGVTPRALVIAGLTGRDEAAVLHHVEELRAIGVKPPPTVPAFFRNGTNLLTSATTVEVLGPDTSGEVEFVLVSLEDGLWVGVGSDHTDRRVEAYAIDVSKQLCPKVVAPLLWRHDEVAPHWDRLVLRAWIEEAGRLVLYQEGTAAALRTPEALIAAWTGGAPLPVGTVMFGGTFAAIGGIRPSTRFEFEIEDPVRGRRIRHGYEVRTLPLI